MVGNANSSKQNKVGYFNLLLIYSFVIFIISHPSIGIMTVILCMYICMYFYHVFIITLPIYTELFSFSMQKQLDELVAEPSGEFKKFTRMSTVDFEDLLMKITPLITKQDTQLREAVPARMRFAITLRYLATGDSFQSLHFLFKVSPQLISTIIPEVCAALCKVLENEIKVSSSDNTYFLIISQMRTKH